MTEHPNARRRPAARVHRPARVLVAGLALVLSACGSGGTTDSGGTAPASPAATGTASAATSTPDPQETTMAQGSPGTQSITELVDGLQSTATALTEELGGRWTLRNGDPYQPLPVGSFPTASCAGSGLGFEPDDAVAGRHVSLELGGPAVADPEAAVEQVLRWAEDRGLTERTSGEGTRFEGSRTVFATAPDAPGVTLEVSTAASHLSITSACSTDGSVLAHEADGSDAPRAPQRFGSPTPSE